MNLYIIGNGFDLDLGFDTSYRSFISSKQFKSLIANNSNNMLAGHINKVFNEEKSLWVDLELIIGNFANEFCDDEENIFRTQFNEIKKSLKEFLKNQTNQNTDQEITPAFNVLRSLLEETKKGEKVNVINFNYTNNIIPRLKYLNAGRELDKRLFKYHQPHGNLNEDIALGVNEDYLKNSGNKYYFIKKGHSDSYKLNNWTETYTNANKIVIFGHSLGVTDSDIIKTMFQYYLKNKKISRTLHIYDLKENKNNVSRKIEELLTGKINSFKLDNTLEICPDI